MIVSHFWLHHGSAYSTTANLFMEKWQLIRSQEEANNTISRFIWEDGGDVYAGVTKPLPSVLLRNNAITDTKTAPPPPSYSLSKSMCWAAVLKYLRCSPHWDARACTLCSKVDYKSSSYSVWRFNPVVLMTQTRVDLWYMTCCLVLDLMSVLHYWFIAI